MGCHTMLLDEDIVRAWYQPQSRVYGYQVENIRRVSEVAKLMADAGLIAIGALISPFRQMRGSSWRRSSSKCLSTHHYKSVCAVIPTGCAKTNAGRTQKPNLVLLRVACMSRGSAGDD
jgi:adenylylsulfate kinase-like enzyme